MGGVRSEIAVKFLFSGLKINKDGGILVLSFWPLGGESGKLPKHPDVSRSESLGGMERLGVWTCNFWVSEFSRFGA